MRLDGGAARGHWCIVTMSSSTPPETYKPLGDVLKRQGYLYKKIFRQGKWAIYGQYKKAPEKLVAFEVVKIGKHNGFSIAGLFFPPAETYPTSSMWGSSGWTYRELEKAKQSLSEKMAADGGGAVDETIEDGAILREMFRESKGDTDSL